MNSIFTKITLSVVLAFNVGLASAAQVTLTNGDKLTGQLIAMSGGMATFKSPVFGEVKIPFDQIESLVSDENTTVALEDGTQVVGVVNLAKDGSVTFEQSQVQSTGAVTRQNIVALNPPVKTNATKYSGRANLGGTFNRGNSEEDTLNVDAEVVARTATSRYTVALEVNEGSSAGVTTTSNRLLSGKYDAFLSEKDYLFILLKGESDDQADLNLRSTVGAGYGRQFWETEQSNLSAEAGLSYVNEDYKLAPDESFPSLTLGMKYDRKLFDSAMVLFNNTSVTSSLEDSKDTLLKNKLGLRFPMGNGLNVSTQFNVDYDNQPAAGAKKTDTSLIFSIGYGF